MIYTTVKVSHPFQGTREPSSNEISEKLGAGVERRIGKNLADVGHYYDFAGSYRINSDLIGIKGKKPKRPIQDHEIRCSEAIVKHSAPSGHKVDLYSGVKDDTLSKLAKNSKDGILHSPAHISTTHDKHMAMGYSLRAKNYKEGSKLHVVHIAVTPKDKILHVSRLSNNQFGDHHETIIPAGTKLKYSHSTDHPRGSDYHSSPVRVHHFTIHSQDELGAKHSDIETRKEQDKEWMKAEARRYGYKYEP